MYSQAFPTRKLLLALLAVATGVVLASWMQVSHTGLAFAGYSLPSLCIYESLGHACPGCGTTRAGVLLLQGQLLESLRLQPALPLFLLAGLFNLRQKSSTQFSWARSFALLGLVVASWNLIPHFVS